MATLWEAFLLGVSSLLMEEACYPRRRLHLFTYQRRTGAWVFIWVTQLHL